MPKLLEIIAYDTVTTPIIDLNIDYKNYYSDFNMYLAKLISLNSLQVKYNFKKIV